MTVGEHLEELRTRLIRGIVGFVIGTAICLALAKTVIFPIFTWPLPHRRGPDYTGVPASCTLGDPYGWASLARWTCGRGAPA